MIDPQGNWVMYGKYHFDSERYEPLVYRCQDGQLLPFVTHPGQFAESAIVQGMIHFGGNYLYRVESDRVNVLKIADMELLNAKVKRKLIGDGDTIYEFDNVDGMLRIYGNDPGKVAARVSYRESGFYSDMPFLAKGRYVYAWGVADSRPRFIRQVARQFPIVNRVWPKAFSGTIVQVDTVNSSISVLGNSLDTAYIQGMQQNYVYAFKYLEKEKGRILQQLQCWDAMVGEVDLSTYVALAILSFALTLFALNYFTKRFWSVPHETSIQQELQEIVGSDLSEPDQETPHPSPTQEEGNQPTPTLFP
jgi:hypothetical protein